MANAEEQPSVATTTTDLERHLQMYQFHEVSAQKYKSDAWTQTTWILTLSGAVLGFSIDKHVSQRNSPDAIVITLACAVAGLALAVYAMWVLNDMARHVQRHWAMATRLVASTQGLMKYIDPAGSQPVMTAVVEKPKAITRLLWIVMAFSLGHVMWVVYASASLHCTGCPAPAQVRCQPPPSAQPPCPSAPTQTPALPARSDHTPPSSSRSAAADRASG